MNSMFASVIVLALAALMIWLLRRQETTRRSEYGPAGVSEFRTDLPLDVCLDRLGDHRDDDVFDYTCRREMDGSFSLNFTLHRPTQQPVDTLYTMRLDAGRQTVVTLLFRREAFGYKEPVFPAQMLDDFFAAKLDAVRTH